MAVHVSRVGDEDAYGHFFCLDFLTGVELEHPSLVVQVDLLFTRFVGQRKSLGQGTSRLGVGIYQKVALRITFDFLLSGIKINIKTGDK